jgi:pantetheine-phosphate adenylyltransferase
MNKKAIYAGTFDPMTLGHLDVVERAARIFPELIVAVAGATGKKTLFSQEERVDLVRKSTRSLSSSVTVAPFEGLLVEYARSRKVTILVRGLRAFSDFEYEYRNAFSDAKTGLQCPEFHERERNRFDGGKCERICPAGRSRSIGE